jgi:hypothetical protein
MAEIVNLRRARKARSRAEREHNAAENRARFGRGKAEKARTAAETERRERHLDEHRRDRDE